MKTQLKYEDCLKYEYYLKYEDALKNNFKYQPSGVGVTRSLPAKLQRHTACKVQNGR